MHSVRFLQFLGYLGLLPFVVLTLLTLFPLWPELDALTLFQRYSAIILGFMAGVLWPVWAQQASVRPLALFAVSLPVLSFLAGLLPAPYTLAIELLLFIALRLGERWFALDEQYHPSYLQLRRHLTRVVVCCHALMLIALYY
ncbi:MAG: DUF3429 domain-containing protein [Gammaproteobacteria bacterium]|jgi:hypothetical protein|nr:DUF3429 domain-containing protein [Gammaproteobacteria bacterium]MBU2178416.1 DUF3429 domain-containing protein [Gammaproteobacteria bacterium]MBU2223162.1 DUF3429 domain-containing protein [Gammaproteobacteria bacterium]MBU2278561.1 DUF3429 domain-containing protein [Gammaproteobacteria bacterium]MBU2425718.1 DUF3429 domain-containing protein [Gammaproteobacteria bacterium]